MTIAEKLEHIARNSMRLYREGEISCILNHYIAVIVGDGSTQLSFPLVFDPDLVSVTGFSPAAYKQNNTVAHFIGDLSSFGFITALSSAYNTAGTLASTPISSEALLKRFSRSEESIATVGTLRGSAVGETAVFQKGVPYVVVAVRYEKASDRERITEYVNSLTGSGTAMLSRRKILAAFSEEEWQALIATKPDWTFTLN